MLQRWHLSLSGVVQGIGLRPLLYQLSHQYQLTGSVQNTDCNVSLYWQGQIAFLTQGVTALCKQLQKFGKINLTKTVHPVIPETTFCIKASCGRGPVHSLISADLATCDLCLVELFDPANRRYQYPFITCAHCGPRYSISSQLPYDRYHTSMAGFPMCKACQQEYEDPSQRRFHAQAFSCWDCGPTLSWWNKEGLLVTGQQALLETISALKAGKIVAVKGIGGFHLMVLASDERAVEVLRARKHRPDKPFALMVKDWVQAQELCYLDEQEIMALSQPASPIILAKRRQNTSLTISGLVAPKQSTLGIMLAYAPIHHLLLAALEAPLVATSANVQGEPLCYRNDEALSTLKQIADFWLCHDRDILHPIEDSIMQQLDGKMCVLRRGRGLIPYALPAKYSTESFLALGGHLKNSIALYHQDRILLSPYIGDLDAAKSVERFQQAQKPFQQLAPQAKILADMHPDYASSREARRMEDSVHSIQHHQAHICSVMAEHQLTCSVLGLAWDGLGWGEEGHFWGGETFIISNNKINRVATLLKFVLPGGEKAIKEPRRVALSLLYTLYKDNLWQYAPPALRSSFTENEKKALLSLLKSAMPSFFCSSMGRLFDGVAALLGLIQVTTFEGQAAMLLEALAESGIENSSSYPNRHFWQNDLLVIDWRPMVAAILADLQQNKEKCQIAQKFHAWCVEEICNSASLFKASTVVMSGGVFQNKLLLEAASDRLRQQGVAVYCAEKLPPNDGGLAVGQVFAMSLFAR